MQKYTEVIFQKLEINFKINYFIMKKFILNVLQTYMVLLESTFSAQATIISTQVLHNKHRLPSSQFQTYKYSISYLLRFKVSYSVHTIYVENDINNKYKSAFEIVLNVFCVC